MPRSRALRSIFFPHAWLTVAIPMSSARADPCALQNFMKVLSKLANVREPVDAAVVPGMREVSDGPGSSPQQGEGMRRVGRAGAPAGRPARAPRHRPGVPATGDVYGAAAPPRRS